MEINKNLKRGFDAAKNRVSIMPTSDKLFALSSVIETIGLVFMLIEAVKTNKEEK